MRMLKLSFISLTGAVSLLTLSACSMMPKSISDQSQLRSTYYPFNRIMKEQAKLPATVTLSEAVARTLKYNLDERVQMAQELLTTGNFKLAQLAMLPSSNMAFNHSFRNNEQIQNLVQNGQIVQGDQSFTPKQVQNTTADIQWNILDFGLSYVRAKQQANQVLIAHEERRKITQNLIQETISTYWRAWTAQRLSPELVRYKRQVSQALKRSQQMTAKHLGNMQNEMDYQQVLVRALRRANQLEIQISDAKSRLAQLMNIMPGAPFKLTKPDYVVSGLPSVEVPMKKLDTIALVDRPELRQASYETKIQKYGIKAAVLNLMPGVNFDFGYNHTDNEFMKNRKWYSANYEASWDLLRTVAEGPYDYNLAKSSTKLQRLKQAATTIAVLTQVRVAQNAYQLAMEDYRYAHEDAKISNKLYQYALNQHSADQGNQQIVIRRGIDRLNSDFDEAVSFTQAQQRLEKLYQAVGIDTLKLIDLHLPLPQLAAKVRSRLVAQSQGDFNIIASQRYHKLRTIMEKMSKKKSVYHHAKAKPIESKKA